MREHRFPYNWTLKDSNFTKDKGKVFSCFACGGGSSFGYKLAGFDVIGMNEIDPKMAEAYITNHNPKYSYIEPIQTFKLREDLPQDLYELDILDGSPPCSNFSMAGNREKDWGKEKVFREGQAMQVLDTLFFDFIDLAKKLQPKVVVAENVKGLLMGAAKEYVIQIYREFDKAGYYCQHWLLDASKMGVPQRRERVFFIALRKDLATPFLFQKDMFTVVPKLELKFNEHKILCKQITTEDEVENMPKSCLREWLKMDGIFGSLSKVHDKGSFFNEIKINPDSVCDTLTSQGKLYHYAIPRRLNNIEFCHISTFPIDYDFKTNKSFYICGMSVPPVMIAQIASNIYEQWLKKL